jgi:hypothetical protein
LGSFAPLIKTAFVLTDKEPLMSALPVNGNVFAFSAYDDDSA